MEFPKVCFSGVMKFKLSLVSCSISSSFERGEKVFLLNLLLNIRRALWARSSFIFLPIVFLSFFLTTLSITYRVFLGILTHTAECRRFLPFSVKYHFLSSSGEWNGEGDMYNLSITSWLWSLLFGLRFFCPPFLFFGDKGRSVFWFSAVVLSFW